MNGFGLQEALLEALQQGQIGAAGLDVTEPEPLPRDHKLLGLSNVVFMPHRGSATIRTRRAMSALCIKNLVAGLNGEDLSARCDLDNKRKRE